MKKSKILAPALAVLCLSVAASVTGTVAWFAANNVVSATGMQINASAPASIVISKDSLPTSETTGVTVSFSGTEHSMNPCTYTNTLGSPYLGTPNLTGDKISKSTGLPILESDYTNMTYNVASDGTNYYHAVIYIATAPHTAPLAAADAKTLTVSLSNVGDAPSTTQLAGSISYFVNYVSDPATGDNIGEYKGTLNLAGKDRIANNTSALDPNNLTLYTTTELTPIPSADTGKGVRIDMFAYFDGALLSADGETYANKAAYVTTDTLNINGLSLTSTFSI
ncbi:MAG: hypothetical protein WC201_02280 [Bacilli bacterium]